MHIALLASSLLLTTVLASPVVRHVIHEKRSGPPPSWEKALRPDPSFRTAFRIALTQEKLDSGADHLLAVSDPSSAAFAKHWTAKQVAEYFAPSSSTVDAVRSWVESAIHIDSSRIKLSQSLSWLHISLTIAEAETLLQTQYHLYTHTETGKVHLACEHYSVPEQIRPHIDFITPTVHFDAKIYPPRPDGSSSHNKREEKSTAGHTVEVKQAIKVGSPDSGTIPKKGADINIQSILDQLQNCHSIITPNCLRALYRFPPAIGSAPGNSFGIVEYTPQSYLQSDLDLFFRNFSSGAVGSSPKLDSIDGGVPQSTLKGFGFNGESDLDLEYAMSLVYPQVVTLYQVGDAYEGASFNNFLDAIDASYCTFRGGDDLNQDASYPDVLFAGGYTGPQNCGGFAATKVISTSYGYNEADLTPAYERRQCAEYMKFGLQGATVLYSSGDYGVAGNRGRCIDAKTGLFNSGLSGLFNPSFPSTCPYITSVGATQINRGASVFDAESACQQVIRSGGGFSNVFPLPAYQRSAVSSYYRDHAPPYGPDRYNNSRHVRAYPDVAANGANYLVAVDGNFSLVYGTSASAPTFGAIITLLNQLRLSIGKRSVGFLNPTLYAHPDVLFDITSGGNQGCGTPGFTAVPGWDPVTGLGTPNFPKLAALYLGLP